VRLSASRHGNSSNRPPWLLTTEQELAGSGGDIGPTSLIVRPTSQLCQSGGRVFVRSVSRGIQRMFGLFGGAGVGAFVGAASLLPDDPGRVET